MKLDETMKRLHPASDASPELAARVERLAAEADRVNEARATRQRPRRWPVAVAAGLAVASWAGVAVFTTSKVSVARTMKAVSANLSSARGIHYSLTFAAKPTGSFTYTAWQLGDSWRTDFAMDGKRFTQMVTGGKFWNISPGEKEGSYQSIGSTMRKAPFRIEGFQEQVKKALHGGRGSDLGTAELGGRRLRKIAAPGSVQRTLFSAPEAGRTVLWIDTERMLPVRVEQQLPEQGAWRTVCTLDYDAAISVSPDVFRVPPGIATYSVEELGARVGRRYTRPVAEKRFATRTLAIRDLQMNRDGDIFVLYTHGSTPKNWLQDTGFTITNDRGTKYAGTAGAVQSYMYHEDRPMNRGMITPDGQVIESLNLVPATPEGKLKGNEIPRTFTIKMTFGERVNGKSFGRVARFTLPVKPRPALLPSYAPDLARLGLAGGDALSYRRSRELGRRSHFWNERDWRGMIRSTDREIREGIADVNTYLSRGEAFVNLRQEDEARAALAQAEREDTNGFYAAQIEEVRKRLP